MEEITKELSEFYNHIIDRYGEDIAYAMTTWKPTIKESINYYSKNKFEKYTDKEIYKEFIRNIILCDDNDNMMVTFTKKMIGANDIDSLYNCIEHHEIYKDQIVKSYIKNVHIPFEKKLERCTDENKVLFLNKINNYDEYIEKYNKMKRKKR